MAPLVDIFTYLELEKHTPLTCFAKDCICVRLERILVLCIESLHLVPIGNHIGNEVLFTLASYYHLDGFVLWWIVEHHLVIVRGSDRWGFVLITAGVSRRAILLESRGLERSLVIHRLPH